MADKKDFIVRAGLTVSTNATINTAVNVGSVVINTTSVAANSLTAYGGVIRAGQDATNTVIANTAISGGIYSQRAFNLIGTDAVLKVSRTANSNPAYELQQWDGATLQGYFDLGANQNTFFIRNRISGTAVNLFIDGSGNVGISNTAPADKLSVNGTAYFGSDVTVAGNLTVTGTTVTVNTTTLDVKDLNITVAKGAGSSALSNGAGLTVDFPNAQLFYTSSDDSWNSNKPFDVVVNTTTDAVRITQTGSGNALVVEDSTNPDSTPFVINQNGIVSAGWTGGTITTAYGSTVQKIQSVLSNDAAGPQIIAATYANNVFGARFDFVKSRSSTVNAQAVLQNNDSIGDILFGASDGTKVIPGALINATVDGTASTDDMPTRLSFWTTADGANTVTERMRIQSNGKIYLGSSLAASTTANFVVGQNIDGSTFGFGIISGGTVQSGVTNQVQNFSSGLRTVAASFTLGTYYHFIATQQSIGAGSSVTNQHGYFADAGLIGATNNFGFYGNIPDGTGRWNFYANGTAPNYFAGRVGVGVTSPQAILDVTGSSTSSYSLQLRSGDVAAGTDSAQIIFSFNGAPYNSSGYAHSIRTRHSAGTEINNAIDFWLWTNADTPSTLGSRRVMTIEGTGRVGIGTATPGYNLEVNGSFAATTKSFVIDHPTKPGKKLRYASLEGPENGVYVRGKLEGTNVITLPEYWTKLIDPDTISVNLTPYGSAQSLYVLRIEDNKIIIASENMSYASIKCFYTVYAERDDVSKLVVEY